MLRELSAALAWLTVVLPILAGAYGLWAVFRPPVRDRTDRLPAIGCSALVAVVAGAGLGVVGYLLESGFTGRRPQLMELVASVAPIAALFGLASFGGYAFFARRHADPIVLVGILAGPAVLILVPLFVASAVGRAAGL